MRAVKATASRAHTMLTAIVLAACLRSGTKPVACEANPSSSPRPSIDGDAESTSPVTLSRQWLRAFRDGDVPALQGLTCSPFAFRTTLGSIRCPASAHGGGELEELVRCVRSNALLADELKYADELPHSAEHRQLLPEWARTLGAESNSGLESVYSYLHGDGVTFGFALLVRKDCVDALLLNADFDEDTGP